MDMELFTSTQTMVKFGYTRNKFLQKVMGLLDKLKQNINIEASNSQEKDAFSLSKQEIEFLLILLKDSTFRGEHVEILYSLVYKLQKQHQNIK